MIHKKGHCLKCGVRIMEGRKALHNYICQGYKLEDGNVILIGMCNNCVLQPSEYDLAVEALEKGEHIGVPLKIVGLHEEKIEIPKALLICSECGKKIEGNFVYNVGTYRHERCDEPKYVSKKVIKKEVKKVDKTKAKRTSRKDEKELSS